LLAGAGARGGVQGAARSLSRTSDAFARDGLRRAHGSFLRVKRFITDNFARRQQLRLLLHLLLQARISCAQLNYAIASRLPAAAVTPASAQRVTPVLLERSRSAVHPYAAALVLLPTDCAVSTSVLTSVLLGRRRGVATAKRAEFQSRARQPRRVPPRRWEASWSSV